MVTFNKYETYLEIMYFDANGNGSENAGDELIAF
jgi:hypothetical protein